MTLPELKKSMADAVAEAQTVINQAKKDNRPLSIEERTAVETHTAAAMKFERQIDEIRASDTAMESVTALAAKVNVPEARKVPASNLTETRTFTAPPDTYARYGALKAFKGEGAERRAYTAGQFFRAAFQGSEQARTWLRDNGIQLRAVENVNSLGGFLVPDEFLNDVIDNRENYGVARKWARVVPMGRDHMLVPVRKSGLTSAFYGEAAQITSSEMAWGQVELTAKKLGCMSLMSNELAEDAVVSIGDWLVAEIALSFATLEDKVVFTGDGSAAMAGMTGFTTMFESSGVLDTYAGAVNATIGHNTAAAITIADLASLMAALPQYADGNAAFYCSKAMKSNVFDRLKASGGGNQVMSLAGKPQDQWLGYDIRITQTLPSGSSGLDDKTMILFGDLSRAAIIGDRRQLSVARSTDLKFDYDQIAIRATERFCSVVNDIGSATQAGPVVALMGN